MLALVDESYRAASPGLFVLAAVAVEQDADLDALRYQVRSVKAKRKAFFHWRDEDEALRLAMLGLLSSVSLGGLTVVAASPVRPPRQERARGACMRRLVWELRQLGVSQLMIESRGTQDAADRRVLSGLRQMGETPRPFAYSHAGKTEPLLWLPDAVAGAAAHDLSSARTDYIALLPDLRLVAAEGVA